MITEEAPKLRIQIDMQYPGFKIAIYELMELKNLTFEQIQNVILKCKNELEYYERREKRHKDRWED